MSYPYARLGGRMVLRGALHMPMQSEAWSMLSTYTQVGGVGRGGA
jgi:hypothetical protein